MEREDKSKIGPKRQATYKTNMGEKGTKLHHDEFPLLSETSKNISQFSNTPYNNKISHCSKPLQPGLLNKRNSDSVKENLRVETSASENCLTNGRSKTTRPESNEDVLCTSDREEELFSRASKTLSIKSSSNASNESEGDSCHRHTNSLGDQSKLPCRKENKKISSSDFEVQRVLASNISPSIGSTSNKKTQSPQCNEAIGDTDSEKDRNHVSTHHSSKDSNPISGNSKTLNPNSYEGIENSIKGSSSKEKNIHATNTSKRTNPKSDDSETPCRKSNKRICTNPIGSNSQTPSHKSNESQAGSSIEKKCIRAPKTPIFKDRSRSGENKTKRSHLVKPTKQCYFIKQDRETQQDRELVKTFIKMKDPTPISGNSKTLNPKFYEDIENSIKGSSSKEKNIHTTEPPSSKRTNSKSYLSEISCHISNKRIRSSDSEKEMVRASKAPYFKQSSISGNNETPYFQPNNCTDGSDSRKEIIYSHKDCIVNDKGLITGSEEALTSSEEDSYINSGSNTTSCSLSNATSDRTDSKEKIFHDSTNPNSTNTSSKSNNATEGLRNKKVMHRAFKTPPSKHSSIRGNNKTIYPHLNESVQGSDCGEAIIPASKTPPSIGSQTINPSQNILGLSNAGPQFDIGSPSCSKVPFVYCFNQTKQYTAHENIAKLSPVTKCNVPLNIVQNNANPTNTTRDNTDLVQYINQALGWNLKCDDSSGMKGQNSNTNGGNNEQETQEGSKVESISDILFPEQNNRMKNTPALPTTPIKTKIVSGDEYQRVLQMLVRQRGVSDEPGSKVGTEVAGVGKLDDIVYVQGGNSGNCRFFQVKHCKIKKISINKEFLKTNFRQKHHTSADFYLLRFFKSFLKEHENIRSNHIKEIVFITERGLDLRSIDSRGLFKETQNSEGYNDDDCLNLKKVGAIKYSLDLNWLKTHKIGFFKHLTSLNNEVNDNECVNEFFQKLRVVVSYLDHKCINTLKCNGNIVEVNNINDIVCKDGMTPICRFFVNYTKGSEIQTKELLQTRFPRKIKGDYNLHLLLYLKSFLDIKRHKVFGNRQISEITFVTNRRLESNSTKESPMEEEDLKNDKCLYLQYPGIKKLKVRQNVKDVITTFLLAQPRFGKVTKNILEEFLDKIRLVVGYPDLECLMKSTFNEVFGAEAFRNGSECVLGNYALHTEVRLLRDEEEFCTCENWRKKVDDEISKFLRWSKLIGISDHRQKLTLATNEVVSQNTNTIKQDVSSFVNSENDKIMAISVMNLESNAKNVIKVLEGLELTQKIIYLYLEDLLADPSIMDCFQENSGILVLTCGKQKEINNVSELVSETGKSLTHTDLNIILLSRMCGNNAFYEGLVSLPELKNRVVNKQYKHEFKDLTDQSQNNILSKVVIFQGIKTTLGRLLSENIDYASEIIDESILWNYIDSQDSIVEVGEASSITSEWYEQIPRYISKRYVSFRSVKKYSGIILFIIKTHNYGHCMKIRKELQRYKINEGHHIYQTGVILVPRNSEQLIEQLVARNTSHCVLLCMDLELYFLSGLGLRLKLQDKITEEKKLYIQDIVKRIQLKNQGDDSGCSVNILAADSGVGKSTFLAVMATEIKKANPNVWVSKIELRSVFCSKMKASLEDLSDYKNAVKLLSFIVLCNDGEDQLESKILKIGLQMKQNNTLKMVVLLDGYNEINEKYRENVCTLVEKLKNNCNIHSIWISTQTHKIVELENRFNEAAFFLNDLTVDDQVKLMVGAWKNNDNCPNYYSEEQMTNDAKSALTDWENTIVDTNKSFTTIPLNIIMLAKVLMHYGKKINNITNNMNLTNLYKAFVEIKIHMFNRCTKEEEQPLDEATAIFFSHMMPRVLMQVAAKYYFDLHTAKKYDGYKKLPGLDVIDEFRKLIKEDNFNRALIKLGLVKITTEIYFTHESFGQFFFAEYVLNNMNNEFVQIFFVSHLFKANNLQLCRRILNSNFGEMRSERKYNLGSIKICKRASKSLLNASLDTSANCMRREQLGNTMAFIFHSLDEEEFISYKDKVIKLRTATWQNCDLSIETLQSLQSKKRLALFCTS